jgi:DNA-binding response OmpR family regulator
MNKKKVLIIDDDISCLDVMQLVINGLEYDTYAFSSWESSTIKDIISIAPDVIILDEWLIGIKGSEICIILKSINELRRVPVVLVSGVDGLEEIARKSLADGYINKPFDISEVENMVMRFGND